VNHFAIGALAEDGQGLGVARFVRLEPGGEVAEAAIAVVDEVQGKGLGRALLERLLAAARERGVTKFHAEVLADNAPMLALLRHAGDVVESREEPGVVTVEMPLPEPTPAPASGLMGEIFRLVAQGLLRIRTRFPH
jgi:GNAT superfamily N-acetyltransferase